MSCYLPAYHTNSKVSIHVAQKPYGHLRESGVSEDGHRGGMVSGAGP